MQLRVHLTSQSPSMQCSGLAHQVKSSAVSVPRVCVHELPPLLRDVIAQALEKHSCEHTDLKHMTHTKYRSSSLLSTLWVLWLVCFFPTLCPCVPLNAVLGPLKKLVKNSLLSQKMKRQSNCWWKNYLLKFYMLKQ